MQVLPGEILSELGAAPVKKRPENYSPPRPVLLKRLAIQIRRQLPQILDLIRHPLVRR